MKISARETKKTSKHRPLAAMKTKGRPYEAPKIEDSGAVKEARSSVENIVEDAQKKLKRH